MKRHSFLIILTLFISFNFEISAQSITIIPNPENYGGVGDYDSGFFPIIFNNSLYFEYADSTWQSSHNLLAKYDETSVTLISNPDNGYGFQGWIGSIIFDNSLFFVYENSSGKNQLAKFDGSNITLIPNPDNGNVRYYLTIFNNALYFSYSDSSSHKWQLAKYDGSSLTLIPNPDNGYGLYYTNLAVFNNEIYFAYRNVSNKIQLAKYNGSSTTLINNPDIDGKVNGFDILIYNNALYFKYEHIGSNQLVKYDGANFTMISNPDNGSIDIGEGRYTIFNNELFFTYYNSASKYQLAKFDGNTITLITNPNSGDGWAYSNLLSYNNALYFQYKDTYLKNKLTKYDGTNITLINNPDTSGGLGGYDAGQKLIVFDNELYFHYHTNSQSMNYHLAKYNGTSIILIPNPNNGIGVCRPSHGDEPFEQIVYNNALYFPYTDSSNKIQLAKYTGTNSINEQVINSSISIFPNPVYDNLVIVQQRELKNGTIEMYNMKGQMKLQQNFQNIQTTIDINSLAKGMYIIKVKTEKEITILKFIKE